MVVWIEIPCFPDIQDISPVTTCVVVWIEIGTLTISAGRLIVTTCVVVWIEILLPLSPGPRP